MDNSLMLKAEVIVLDIVNKQTPNVDEISGATTTSKALCKAVENVLTLSGILTKDYYL